MQFYLVWWSITTEYLFVFRNIGILHRKTPRTFVQSVLYFGLFGEKVCPSHPAFAFRLVSHPAFAFRLVRRGLSTSFSIYFIRFKTKCAKKTKLLFHKIIKFHPHTIRSTFTPHQFRDFSPGFLFKHLMFNNPAHPEWYLFHPLLDLYF